MVKRVCSGCEFYVERTSNKSYCSHPEREGWLNEVGECPDWFPRQKEECKGCKLTFVPGRGGVCPHLLEESNGGACPFFDSFLPKNNMENILQARDVHSMAKILQGLPVNGSLEEIEAMLLDRPYEES